MKRFLTVLLITTIFFLAGVIVGRFVMPRKIVVNTVDIKELVEIIERYNKAKYELEKIKEWNKNVVLESKPEKVKK